MILDAITNALQKDINNMAWLPIVFTIFKIVLAVLIPILVINAMMSISKIKNETIRIRELLEDLLKQKDK